MTQTQFSSTALTVFENLLYCIFENRALMNGHLASQITTNPLAVHLRKFSQFALKITAIMICASSATFWVLLGDQEPQELSPFGLAELVKMPSNGLRKCDLSQMNLICGEGLIKGEPISIFLDRLDQWAERVKTETARNWHLYERNPKEYERSPEFFKMVMMGVVLAEDFHVQYDPARRSDAGATSVGEGFFGQPQRVFLHGLLGPERMGTCSSMPVLYTAIGRRLGYPLKLVTTKGHLFVRWDGQGERFNVEVTGRGVNRFPNEYYLTWPFTVTPEEVQAEDYLKPLEPAEELAVFLSIRGMCLREAGRLEEAREGFRQASTLAPKVQSYSVLASAQAPVAIKPAKRRLGQR